MKNDVCPYDLLTKFHLRERIQKNVSSSWLCVLRKNFITSHSVSAVSNRYWRQSNCCVRTLHLQASLHSSALCFLSGFTKRSVIVPVPVIVVVGRWDVCGGERCPDPEPLHQAAQGLESPGDGEERRERMGFFFLIHRLQGAGRHWGTEAQRGGLNMRFWCVWERERRFVHVYEPLVSVYSPWLSWL